jgi:hypothetical protein
MTSKRPLGVMIAAVALVLVGELLNVRAVPVAAQSATTTSPHLRTAWGDPDLQGIWNQVFNTPLERPARFANREFFTDERAEFDRLPHRLPPYPAIEAATRSFDGVSVRRIRQSGW